MTRTVIFSIFIVPPSQIDQLGYFVQCSVETENHHMVVGLYPGITGHDHTVAVAHQATDGQVRREFQLLHRGLGDFGVLLGHQFHHFGVRQGQTLGIRRVFIEQQLEDAAGCQQFLVDDVADVQPFGRGDELQVLDLGNGLFYS